MKAKRYRKPPITEAVIGIRFHEPIDERLAERFRIKRKRVYPLMQELKNYTINIEKKSVDTDVRGHKLSSNDGLSVAMVIGNEVNTVRLAPYCGWDDLLATATENWDALVELSGRMSVKALTTRYINRIDIPYRHLKSEQEVGEFKLAEYFNLSIGLSKGACMAGRSDFAVKQVSLAADKQAQYVINFASIVPELIDHLSFILDIDTATNQPLPNKLEDAWAMLEDLHSKKNACFEECITDKTRELFQ